MSYAAAAEAGPVRPGTGRVRHHLLPALLAAVAVAALVGTGSLDSDAALPVVVGVLQLALVAAWLPATGATAGTAVIGIAAAAGADAAFLVPARPHLGDLLVVLGPAFLVVVLGQMLRRERRDVVAALAGGVLLVCAVSATATLLLLDPSSGRVEAALLAVGAAVVVGHVVDAVLPVPQLAPDAPRGLLGLALAVGAATTVAWLRRDAAGLADGLAAVTVGAVLGSVAALVAVAASYVAVEAGPGRGRAIGLPVVQALLPIAACAPVVVALQTALQAGAG